MRKGKKSLVYVMVLMLSLTACLAACSKENKVTSETASPSPETNAPASETAKAEELEPVVLNWYYIGEEHPDAQAVFAEANKIIKDKINATVNFNILGWGDYEKKMQLKVAAKEEFDIAFTSDWSFSYYNNVTKGAFLPLDDLIAQYAPQTKEMIPANIWDGTKINGKIYGIPNYQVSFRQPAFIYKKELVDKYNLKDQIMNVKQMSDLTPIFEVIHKNEPEIIPSNIYPNWNRYDVHDASNYLDQVGPFPVDVDASLKVVAPSDAAYTEKTLADYKLAKEWHDKGYFHKDLGIAKDFNAELQAGKFFLNEDVFKPGVEADMKARFGYEVYAVPMGAAMLSTGSITATLSAISKTSKNPERAAMLLELMNTDKELYNMIVFGLEGEHYTKTGDDRIEIVQDTKYAGYAWMMGSQFNAYKLPGQDDDVWEQTKLLNASAYKAPTLGFYLDPEPLKTMAADLTNAISLKQAFSYGIIDDYEAKYKEMQEKMEKAGLAEYIAAVQKQIDAWKATK